jgi:hypothetical protein
VESKIMQYMLLIYNDPARQPAYGTPEFQETMNAFFSLNKTLTADGVLRAGEGLQGVDTARSVRAKAGKVETMDGPFAETREYLGGYYVIDVPDMATALTYAAQIPSVHYGTVEVRPMMDYKPAG